MLCDQTIQMKENTESDDLHMLFSTYYFIKLTV